MSWVPYTSPVNHWLKATPRRLNSLVLLTWPAHAPAHAFVATESPQAKGAGVPGHMGGAPAAPATHTCPFTCQHVHEQLGSASTLSASPLAYQAICLSINTFTCQLIEKLPVLGCKVRTLVCPESGDQEVSPAPVNTGEVHSEALGITRAGPGLISRACMQSFKKRGCSHQLCLVKGRWGELRKI